MAVTIRDVARACGMSISTVSKVFNDYPDISQATRDQVMGVARDIGYKPNAIARALKTNRTYSLGVLFVDENVNASGLTHPFFAAVLNAFKAEVELEGYDITFINHNIGSMAMTYLQHCRYRNVDGVCLACIDFRSPEVAELVNSDIPCVTIDYRFEDCAGVFSDNVGGVKRLVDHAFALGHRRIAFIHGQRNSAVTDVRIDGFLGAMASHALSVPAGYLVEGRYDDVELTPALVAGLLRREDPPTCILLPDDASSFGAQAAARAAGLRVPEDLSIAGYDGIRYAQALSPRLTTIRQDAETMGRRAARSLIQQINHPGSADLSPILVDVQLIEGETMAPVRG